MTDVPDLYRRAMEQFGELLRGVGDDRWDDPTPCTDWSVRDLANHVVGENLWMPPMMEGKTVTDVGDAFDGDLLGDDAAGRWDRAAKEALAAVQEPGALERTVHLSFGDFSGRFYVG
ncbi:MAG TPA: TIGR03086 family metal-binding protein, partial [Actinomycetota bacterium]|nr:TIGR03086 family metal-binding protein [Actinomycetota bacterium]